MHSEKEERILPNEKLEGKKTFFDKNCELSRKQK